MKYIWILLLLTSCVTVKHTNRQPVINKQSTIVKPNKLIEITKPIIIKPKIIKPNVKSY